MRRSLFCIVLSIISVIICSASPVDSLEKILRTAPIQEKTFVQTDNTCYYAGDTIWYRAYVTRADNLHPTDMSRLLYVELLTPDGYLVERQRIVADERGGLCGQFVLPDTMYSGYYELRAYTRWQLNFNVTHQKYNYYARQMFLGKHFANDFFREYEGLWSRVIPIYEKPETPGEYDERYMVDRPRRRLKKTIDDVLLNFYPESGTLVNGLPSRVAFEITDAYGKPLDVVGRLDNNTKLTPTYIGRGVFNLTPSKDKPVKAHFTYGGKNYDFDLPEVSDSGMVLHYDINKNSISVKSRWLKPSALSISCRGVLVSFFRLHGDTVISLNNISMPTGVNEIVVYDEWAAPSASRQIFVNNNDLKANIGIKLSNGNKSVTTKDWVQPYTDLSLDVASDDRSMRTVSIAVRDGRPDMETYDDGNMLTDLLLTSDLKGFVANPGYYFEKSDAEHQQRLDLLMLVQGWRKYAPLKNVRYQPEVTLTYEGVVRKTADDADREIVANNPNAADVDPDDWNYDDNYDNGFQNNTESEDQSIGINPNENNNNDDTEASGNLTANDIADLARFGRKRQRLTKPVNVEAEVVRGKQSAGVVLKVGSDGKFMFQIPPFYDKAILFVQAYEPKDSVKRSISSRQGTRFADPKYIPDYYVQQELFYPVFSKPYSWLQTHEPESTNYSDDDDESVENKHLEGDHDLPTVRVKARRRRGLRLFDRSKPAFVLSISDALNNAIDRGTCQGIYQWNRFPAQLSYSLFGDMGDVTPIRTRAIIDKTTYFFDYSSEEYEGPEVSNYKLETSVSMRRLQDVLVFTDYDLRNKTGKESVNMGVSDVQYIMEDYPDDGQVPDYVDRRYVIDGFTYPLKQYAPDYSQFKPQTPTDYRRTLYWNPSAKLNADGTFHDKFFTNSRSSKVHVYVSGVSADGHIASQTFGINSLK